MKLSRCKPLLGTYVEISIDAEGDFEDIAELSNTAFEVIEQVGDRMSFHDSNSELSKVNQLALDSSIPISKPLAEVIEFSLQLSEQTDGVYDITVAPYLIKSGLLPAEQGNSATRANWRSIELQENEIHFKEALLIDLGGVAKGYAVDLAMKEILSKDPNAKVIINAGGDLKLSQWQGEQVHIPKGELGELVPISMQQAALCTSSYQYVAGELGEDAGHIIHPDLGSAHLLYHSVSVFSPCCMHSDALTKVAALAPDSEVFSNYQASVLHL